MNKIIKIGILGAARIAPMSVIKPARIIPGVEIEAIATRDPEKSRKFAQKHSIPKSYESYDELLASPDIDAVYNPLPNSLHAKWSIKALKAGKHVLCEKPIASNATEAEEMKNVAEETGLNLTEAFHYRYHPMIQRVKEITDSRELGKIKHIKVYFCIPFLPKSDIRFFYNLSGGSTMDTGSYAVNIIRYIFGSEPDVVRAKAKLTRDQIDRFMEADLIFPCGGTAQIVCSLRAMAWPGIQLFVEGSAGGLKCINPILPHLYSKLTVSKPVGKKTEKITGKSTYYYQLASFADSINNGASSLTGAEDGIANMKVIDEVYRKAGLLIRGGQT